MLLLLRLFLLTLGEAKTATVIPSLRDRRAIRRALNVGVNGMNLLSFSRLLVILLLSYPFCSFTLNLEGKYKGMTGGYQCLNRILVSTVPVLGQKDSSDALFTTPKVPIFTTLSHCAMSMRISENLSLH